MTDLLDKATRKRFNASLIILIFLLSGCATTTKIWPPYAKLVISATQTVNLNFDKRASPIQFKVMQLSERTTFDNLTFDQLFNQSHTLLGESLLSEHTLVLQPGEQIEHRIPLQENVTHIAIVAAYQALSDSRWQYVYPVRTYSHGTKHFKLYDKGIAEVDYFFSRNHLRQSQR